MRKQIVTLAAVFALLGSFLAACTAQDQPLSSNPDAVYEQVSVSGFRISVSPQDARDGVITVERVEAPSVSWLTIQKMQNGAAGDVIGYAEIETGVSRNIRIEIDTAQATPTLFAVLHTDSGTIGIFEYPQFDPPIEISGAVVQVAFHALVEGGDQYVTMNDQELEGETVLIEEIFVFEPPVWAVIFNDKDGEPGDVIGYEYVEDGAIEYILVDIDLEKATPILYAFLYEDKGALRAFDPNEDTVLLAYGEPVMAVFEVKLP
jgi:hypothetical protein